LPSMPATKSADKKSVVILGAGYAGIGLARTLSAKLDPALYTLTLIGSRPFFIFYPACIRLVVSSEHDLDGRVLMPYDHLFVKTGSFLQGTATHIVKSAGENGGSVVLENGDRVKFDILVLATGSIWEGPLNFPFTEASTKEWIEKNRKQIKDAKGIVIAGGGAIGCESAGEIRDIYPEKKITLVHGGSQLFSAAYPDKFRKAVETSLRARNIDIILGDFIDTIPEPGVTPITTRSGKTLEGDLVIAARGPRPNTSILSSLGEDILTSKGFVKINPTFQLKSLPDVYAIGDIIDVQEEKQAGKTPGHVSVVAANILSSLQGKEPKSQYKGATEAIIVTNGKNGGVSFVNILWGLVFGNWFSRLIKSKSLLVSMGRGAMGLKD